MDSKKTPYERASCGTTIRSTPLMTKVPCGVIHGKSARNISCSFSSPVVLFLRRTTIESGDSYVFIARFAYCSSQRNSPKENLTSLSSNFLPEWSEIRENSLNTRSAPPSTKSVNDFIWLSTRLGSLMSGSRNFPKYFCGRTDFCFAILTRYPCGVVRRRIKTLIRFLLKGFPALKPFTKSAARTQSARSKCFGILYEVFCGVKYLNPFFLFCFG